MRIGIMLRHIRSQQGGIGTYTCNLLDRLFAIDAHNTYVLIYKDRQALGTYSRFPNVEEVVSRIPTQLLWDQVGVPYIAKQKKLDLVFNPKLSVPLIPGFRTAFVMHGADWFVFPNNYPWHDRLYHRLFAALYFSRASTIFSVSRTSTQEIIQHAGVEPGKICTVYHGVNAEFRPIADREHLENVRRRLHLPEKFILFVGQIYPMKNVGRIIQAYARLRGTIPHKLVLVGKASLKYQEELALIDQLGLAEDVLRPGWVADEDLPAIYNLADMLLFPSLYEGFGIPLLEAMACGCPIVTSDLGAPKEVAEDAALLVDPLDVEQIAIAAGRLLSDPELRKDLIERGFQRVASFTWERCARETLVALTGAFQITS